MKAPTDKAGSAMAARPQRPVLVRLRRQSRREGNSAQILGQATVGSSGSSSLAPLSPAPIH